MIKLQNIIGPSKKHLLKVIEELEKEIISKDKIISELRTRQVPNKTTADVKNGDVPMPGRDY